MNAEDLLARVGLAQRSIGPLAFSELVRAGNEGQVPDEPGAYLILRISDHEVIGIGSTGGGAKRDGTLSERLGLFVAASLGFTVKHSSGQRFWDTRQCHGLRLDDLALVCLPSRRPRETEARLFDAYQAHHPGTLPALCRKRPRS